MDRTSRRRLLVAAAAVPLALAATRLGDVLRVAGDVRRAATDAVRPPESGSTATRCAACGAAGHGMLDPSCPAAPRVGRGTTA
jgi:hypothetical protein